MSVKRFSTTMIMGVAVLALAAITVSSIAQTAAVYSVNVVGFQKISAKSNKLALVQAPFLAISNTLDGIIGDQLTGGKGFTGADQVFYWDQDAQDYMRFWLKNDGLWYTGDAVPLPATNFFIDPDIGFWLISNSSQVRTDQTVVVVGDVVDDDAITNTLVEGLNMVSYPYSAEVDINESGLTNALAAKGATGADNIYLWDTDQGKYNRYWLSNAGRKWYTADAVPVIATGVKVGGGVGFWFERRPISTFSNWVELRPYTLN
ncbi:MAG: hypothetical protein KJ626_02895 [Verrucomicrobia bacterium]|nr:hypothetical protein [Verrucomicrobiota bacterium]